MEEALEQKKFVLRQDPQILSSLIQQESVTSLYN